MIDWKHELFIAANNNGLDVYLPEFRGIAINRILDKIASEKYRKYHTLEHVYELFVRSIGQNTTNLSQDSYMRIVYLFAVFHDAVYDVLPSKTDNFTNEWRSVNLFKECIPELGDKLTIEECDIICRSINASRVNIERSVDFVKSDYRQFPWLVTDRIGVMENLVKESDIHLDKVIEEFKFYEYNSFMEGHLNIAKHIIESLGYSVKQHIGDYEKLLIERKPHNIAIYCGSFNPFHLGHLDIVEKAEKTFDKVVIARGFNPDKIELIGRSSIEMDYDLIKATGYREAITYTGTIFDVYNHYIKLGYKVTFIKGFRNQTDIEYDMNQYRIIRDINPNINFMFIPCDAEYMHISSSAIRNLQKIGMEKEAMRYLCI